MQFRTPINITPCGFRIGYAQRGLLLGSCFAENIGMRMKRYKLPVVFNPFGILFNPASVARTLTRLDSGKLYEANDLTRSGDLWVSFDHHGSLAKVDRDEAVIQSLIEGCAKFWLHNVMARVPPEATVVQDVIKMHPVDDGNMLEADNAVSTDIGELRTLTEKMNELKKQSEVIKTRIVDALGEHTGFLIGGEKAVTFKEKTTKRIDTAALKAEFPQVVAQHQITTSTRVFKLY